MVPLGNKEPNWLTKGTEGDNWIIITEVTLHKVMEWKLIIRVQANQLTKVSLHSTRVQTKPVQTPLWWWVTEPNGSVSLLQQKIRISFSTHTSQRPSQMAARLQSSTHTTFKTKSPTSCCLTTVPCHIWLTHTTQVFPHIWSCAGKHTSSAL